eukprot:74326-Pelagomonas_calceolata.AAC.3
MLFNSFGRQNQDTHDHLNTKSDLLVYGPTTEHTPAQQQQQQQQQQLQQQEQQHQQHLQSHDSRSSGAEEQRGDAPAHTHAQNIGVDADNATPHLGPTADGARSSNSGAVRNGGAADGAGPSSSSPDSRVGGSSRDGSTEATDDTKHSSIVSHGLHPPNATPATRGPHVNGHANGGGCLMSTGSTFTSST